MRDWTEKSPEFVGARYDRLAPIYGVFEWLYGLPFLRIRTKAVAALRLEPGDAMLEVGCGDGRNFVRIERAIGPTGALFGIDLSQRMLARAEARVRRRGWSNVALTLGDVSTYRPPRPVQAVLFAFSYSTMRERHAILRHAWDLLAEGGRLVIVDNSLNPGWARKWLMASSVWVSDRTLIGKPDTDPGEDLAAVAGSADEWEIPLYPGAARFVFCSATKGAGA